MLPSASCTRFPLLPPEWFAFFTAVQTISLKARAHLVTRLLARLERLLLAILIKSGPFPLALESQLGHGPLRTPAYFPRLIPCSVS